MGQPTPYERSFDFTNFGTDFPTTPPPGARFDAEYDALAETLSQLLANLALIQRDDTRLRNRSVGVDQFDDSALELIASGSFNLRLPWVAAASYKIGDLTVVASGVYLCSVAHAASSDFATDLSDGRWVLIFDTTWSASLDASLDAILAAKNMVIGLAHLYPDTTTGLATVGEGEYFSVPANGAGTFLTLYREVGGVAVVIDTYGNKDALDAAVTASIAAAASQVTAAASQVAAASSQTAAAASAAAAATSAGAATAAALAASFYPAARSNVPRGATGTGAITGGSGGTNGTFALAFSGGNFGTNPSGTFTVAGGAVTAISITGPGLYVGASPTAPTLSFAASSGLSGASASLTVDFLAASGRFYWTDHATDSNLAALYQNVSGTATATSPLVTWPKIDPQQTAIRLEYVSHSGAAITAKIPFAGVRIPATLAGVHYLVQVPFAKPVGTPSLKVLANDGVTVLITDTPMYDHNDAATLGPANIWLANDTLRVTRNAGGRWALDHPPDRVTANLSNLVQSVAGYLPSLTRPVRMTQVTQTLYRVEVRLHDDHFRDGLKRRQTDRAIFFIKDMGDAQGIAHLPALNSIESVIAGHETQHSEFLFDQIVGAITANTGLVPSTAEAVLKLGKYGVTAPADYGLAGSGHGDVEYISAMLIGTLNDASTANVDVDTSDLLGIGIGNVFEGDKLVFTGVYYHQTPAGAGADRAAKVTITHTFESVSGYQLDIQETADFTDAAVLITPGMRDGSYAAMNPCRDVDTITGVTAGVAGTEFAVGNMDDSQKTLVHPDKIVCSHSDFPHAKLEMILGFGPGVTHRQNGVDVAFAKNAFVLDESYGPKAYVEIGSAIPVDMSGKVLTFSTKYRVVKAAGVV